LGGEAVSFPQAVGLVGAAESEAWSGERDPGLVGVVGVSLFRSDGTIDAATASETEIDSRQASHQSRPRTVGTPVIAALLELP